MRKQEAKKRKNKLSDPRVRRIIFWAIQGEGRERILPDETIEFSREERGLSLLLAVAAAAAADRRCNHSAS